MASAERQLSYELRGYRLRDALHIPGLVKGLPGLVDDNVEALRRDFPSVVGNHRSTITSLKAIKAVQNNSDVRAFTVRERSGYPAAPGSVPFDAEEVGLSAPVDIHNRLIGVATARLGHVTVEGARYEGVGIAGWLDRQYRMQRVGSRVAPQLMAQATELGVAAGVGQIFTVVRPENRVSTALVESMGLEPVGVPVDYSDEMGDGVSTPRQFFAKPIDS